MREKNNLYRMNLIEKCGLMKATGELDNKKDPRPALVEQSTRMSSQFNVSSDEKLHELCQSIESEDSIIPGFTDDDVRMFKEVVKVVSEGRILI